VPKGPGAPRHPRKLPLTDDHIRASVAGGMDEKGHYQELIYGGIQTKERALEIKRSLYRCAKHLGYSVVANIERSPNGTYQVRYKAIDKATARRYIAAKYKGREHEMPYNPFAKTKNME
jgi:hypothetical protein